MRFRSTRFVHLAIGQLPNGEWSHFDETTRQRVGPVYRTLSECEADTTRFANEVWCNGQTR